MMNGKRWILEVITLNGISFGNAFWTAFITNLSVLQILLQILLILATLFYTGLKIWAFFKKKKDK